VVIADQQDTRILNEEPPLSGDLCELARPVAKWVCELRTPSEIPRQIRRAFHEALSPPKGPVFISAPVNILLAQTPGSRVIAPPQTSPLGAAESTFLKKAAKALVSAKRPCVIAGNEVSLYSARKECVALVEVLGCPAFSEPLPTGVNFPNRHPQFAGVMPLDIHKASQLMSSFDVILLLGVQTRLPSNLGEPPLFPPESLVVQLNVEAGLAGRTLPCDLTAIADVTESLSRLRAEIQVIVDTNWVAAVKQRANRSIAAIAKHRQEVEESITFPAPNAPIPLIWLLRLLDAVRSQKSMVVSDVVCDFPNPFEILCLENSSAYFSSNAGIGGYALAAALGVQWSSPESSVVCLTSDESALCYPQALWTASHYGLHVKFVIINNLGRANFSVQLAAIPNNPNRVLLDNPAIDLPELARSMRVPSASVSTISALESSLQQMFETPGPYVLDVHIEDTLD
jgi:benzoylformate decarboxylase